jgi:hypothetical protein
MGQKRRGSVLRCAKPDSSLATDPLIQTTQFPATSRSPGTHFPDEPKMRCTAIAQPMIFSVGFSCSISCNSRSSCRCVPLSLVLYMMSRVGEGSSVVRLRLTSVSGFPLLWRNIRLPCIETPLPPRQTGRAVFPHPAFPRPPWACVGMCRTIERWCGHKGLNPRVWRWPRTDRPFGNRKDR